MESKGHRKVSDSDMDNIKRATEHRLRFKKQGNMNNQKQLPPKLVENIRQINSATDQCFSDTGLCDENCSGHGCPKWDVHAEQCAQVAADYAEEEKKELIELLNESINEIIKLKHHYHDVGHSLKYINKVHQLLKKHEDGK